VEGARLRLIAFNKPYGVVCQFSPHDKWQSLSDFIQEPDVYPCGRLDADSEGLLLLSDTGWIQHKIAHPGEKLPKTYWVQVEGVPDKERLQALASGVVLKGKRTLPARVHVLREEPKLWERMPPVRFRKTVPDFWLEISIREGRNRQIRRMTAAVGWPTLRLVRTRIGPFSLSDLSPGDWRELEVPAQWLSDQKRQKPDKKETRHDHSRHRGRHHGKTRPIPARRRD
jgi:23S rRNA pseudouridine2457 synthase